MIVSVTGVPGTGKTTFSKRLAEAGGRYVDGTAFIEEHGLSEGYDENSGSLIVDPDTFSRALISHLALKEKNKEQKPREFDSYDAVLEELSGRVDVVIDSHLSHYLPVEFVDVCVVMHCELSVLKGRLEARGYSKKKVRENLDAEIFDVCGVEAREAGHVVWTKTI